MLAAEEEGCEETESFLSSQMPFLDHIMDGLSGFSKLIEHLDGGIAVGSE